MNEQLMIDKRMNDLWVPVDPLGETLHFLRMSGVFYTRSEFTAPWALALPAMPGCLMFHVVTAGRCWLEVEGAEHRLLQPGDFALVPHGEGHRGSSAPGVPAAKLSICHASRSANGTRSCGTAAAAQPRSSCAAQFASITRPHSTWSSSCRRSSASRPGIHLRWTGFRARCA